MSRQRICRTTKDLADMQKADEKMDTKKLQSGSKIWRTGICQAGVIAIALVTLALAGMSPKHSKPAKAADATAAPSAAASDTTSTSKPAATVDPNAPISVMDAPVEQKITRKGLIYEYTGISASLIGCTNAAKSKTTIKVPAKIVVKDIYYDVTIIDGNAFNGCINLRKVTLGKNVKQIRYNAFMGDRDLSKIIFKGKKLKQVGQNAFKNTADMPVFRMPSSVKKSYTKLIKHGNPSNWATYRKL